MMSKEEWIEMYNDCVATIKCHLARGNIKQAQHYDRVRVEILHKIDDMGGLE